MSTRELSYTVLEGNLLTFHFPDGDTMEGYLCGIDDFHMRVINRVDGHRWLVHKASGMRIRIGDKLYEQEPEREEWEHVVGPFREWVAKALNPRSRQEAS